MAAWASAKECALVPATVRCQLTPSNFEHLSSLERSKSHDQILARREPAVAGPGRNCMEEPAHILGHAEPEIRGLITPAPIIRAPTDRLLSRGDVRTGT